MANEIFISYSRVNYDQVRAIKDKIDNEIGINCWMDLDGIESDKQFVDVIINAINKHDTLLFMMSSSSMQSNWALNELAFAERKKKRIILIDLDKSEMTDQFYFRYHSKDIIDWSNLMQRNKLIKNLKKWLTSSQSSKTSTSIDNFNKNLSILEQKVQKGDEYYDKHDYSNAVVYYKECSEKGYAIAQFKLGRCFFHGNGIQKDITEAIKLYRKAAEQGYANAQNELGMCYRKGIGVKIDYEEALKWFKEAAVQGYTYAYTNLGVCYREGLGVKKDVKEAIKWYKLAADQGDIIAQYRIKELEGQ